MTFSTAYIILYAEHHKHLKEAERLVSMNYLIAYAVNDSSYLYGGPYATASGKMRSCTLHNVVMNLDKLPASKKDILDLIELMAVELKIESHRVGFWVRKVVIINWIPLSNSSP